MQHLKTILTKRLLGAAIAAAALITPTLASAQDMPSYVSGNTPDQQIHGTVSAIDGTWNISVADANGYTDSVALHQGTIINPTGLTLVPGMNVTVDGYADGPNFDAVEIDTPYHYAGPAPVAVFYGPGSWYPGYASGWGPSFSLSFDAGSNRFEQHSFVGVSGSFSSARRPFAAQQSPGERYVTSGQRPVSYAPQQQMRFAPQQQQQRNFAPQQQQRFAAPQSRANDARGDSEGGRRQR